MKKFLKISGIILVCVLLLLIALVQRIDRTPYRDTAHYAAWKEQIASKEFPQTEGDLQVGWAMENITPLEPGPMAGYGNRWGKDFEAIHDSLYVRVIAVRNASKTVYLLSADMLIIPPNITGRLANLLEEDGIPITDVHLAATHTHHGQGAWGQKLAGRLFGGKYDVEVEKRLAQQFRGAILKAQQDFVGAEVLYHENKNEDNVRYRLDIDGGTVDPWLRSLVFQRTDGTEAKLITYSAHPTLLRARFMQISRDFPGMLVDSLEAHGADFAMYAAGAVGSMGARVDGEDGMERAKNMASNLNKRLEDGSYTLMPETIISDYFEIPMPDPSVRVSINYALRPWVFKRFFGDHLTYLKITKIGGTLILGIPADFSGEIMRELDAYADSKGIQLIITSFSGGYIGYITPDKLYEKDLYETVTMSWNGYQSGGYLTQVAKDIIDKLAK